MVLMLFLFEDVFCWYVFSENIPSAIKASREAMQEWENRTCIRFVEKRPEDKAFLEFFRAAG